VLRRLAIGLAVLIGVPLVAIPCWIATHRNDLPSPGDDDLAVTRSVVPAGENGYDQLVIAAERSDWPEDADARLKAIRSGEVSDPAWVRSMLARNRSAIAAIERALAASTLQLPPSTSPFDPSSDASDVVLDVLMQIGSLVKLAGAGARLQLATGDLDGAIDRAFLGMRLGSRLGGAESTALIWLMIARSSQANSLGDLEAIARGAPIRPRDARELISRLDTARLGESAWKAAWAGEYQFVKRSFEIVSGDDQSFERDTAMYWVWRLVPSDYLWQPNRTLASMAEFYRSLQRGSALACREAHPRHSTAEDLSWKKVRLLTSPNPVGNILTEIATPNFLRFDLKRCHLETRFALLETMIAARAYWQEHRELPHQLDDLLPAYLPALPEDRFAGAPLRYDRARAVAYAIGDDFTDAAGGDEPDPSNASEPAISLAF
jgi:hypothetical protein